MKKGGFRNCVQKPLGMPVPNHRLTLPIGNVLVCFHVPLVLVLAVWRSTHNLHAIRFHMVIHHIVQFAVSYVIDVIIHHLG
jgi:fumarate reductase subunit D